MRDLIWTLITIWFVLRLVNMFRSQKTVKRHNKSEPRIIKTPADSSGNTDNSLDHKGEYVDFEEVK